jgi:hypothetical protein
MSETRELKRVVSSVIVKAVDFYFRFWTNQEDRMWFWLVWGCLEQSGKTVHVNPMGNAGCSDTFLSWQPSMSSSAGAQANWTKPASRRTKQPSLERSRK